MRTIRDAAGTQWTVFEVRKKAGGARWSYLPTEFGDGWLCFESAVTKRRLTPIPEEWRQASEIDLVRMLGMAQTVNRPNYTLEDRPSSRD